MDPKHNVKHPWFFFPLEEHGDDMLAADGEAIFRNFEVRGSPGWQGGTWRIIPLSKSLMTTIDKPFSPFGRGITLLRGLTNHGYYITTY